MVAALSEQISSPDKRSALVDDALDLLKAEVNDKSGLSGLAIKGAFKLIQGVQPGFVRRVVDHLLDDFLKQMDPLYQESIAKGLAPGALLKERKTDVATALLAVTDKRAEKSQNAVVKKTYAKLRPSAQKHVEAAAPRLSGLIDRHASAG